MEPLTTAVASVVTKFVVDTGVTIGKQLGAKAADAARALAQTVLDRLGQDPAEAKTVERYKANPEAMQPAVEAALSDLLARDQALADQLKDLLAGYQEAAGEGGIQFRDVGGSVQIGDDNIQIDRSSGDITLNR